MAYSTQRYRKGTSPPPPPGKGVWKAIQNLIDVICKNEDLCIAVKDTGRTMLVTAAGGGIGLLFGPVGAGIGAVVGSAVGSNLRRGKPALEVWDNMTQAEKDKLCEAVYRVLIEIGYSFLDVADGLIKWRFIQDPYATTFGGFSKVTNFFRGALRPPDSALGRPAGSLGLSEDEPEFELISCEAELGPRLPVQRAEPLDKWEEHLDPEGRVLNPERVKEQIFRGGVSPSLRREVWKFLLGFYPWESTIQERQDILRKKT
ncbi:UNVERIFIED_CONTAM: hypothetical protein FKN15_023750 [Acipenser sinensis]